MSKSHAAAKSTVEQSTTFATSLEKTAKARASLSADALVPINIDIPSAFISVMAAVPRINAMRAAIVEHAPMIDIDAIDHLEMYAQALGEANGIYLAASQPSDLTTLLNRGIELRALLISDAQALAHRGLIDAKFLSGLRGAVGYVNVSTDLNTLYQLFQSNKSAIVGKSAVTPAELTEAHTIFEKISASLAQRELQSESVATAADTRHRAFTLLVATYEQARRAVAFVRWAEDDVDKIAPSLWAGRGRHYSTDLQPPAPVAPAPAVTPVAPQFAPVGLGLPGGSPFTNGPVNH